MVLSMSMINITKVYFHKKMDKLCTGFWIQDSISICGMSNVHVHCTCTLKSGLFKYDQILSMKYGKDVNLWSSWWRLHVGAMNFSRKSRHTCMKLSLRSFMAQAKRNQISTEIEFYENQNCY